MQRIAVEISARLAQIAKDPPDLAAYLRLHAECVAQFLQPVGISYEMATGQAFQRTFSHNYESLKLREMPAQELSFQRAVRTVSEQFKPLFLDANTVPSQATHGLKAEDAPSPEMLPLHNQTPFQQAFVPIPANKKAVGVLHAWFAVGDSATANARLALLAHAAGEMELYLKARRITDISQELSRINTYARFLEDVAGDQELDSVGWKLVNYAREAVGCDRVCLLVDSRYGLPAAADLPPSDRLALQACSGLRRPHPRSEHAEVLKGHASELLKLAVGAASPDPTKDAAQAGAGEGAAEVSANSPKEAPPTTTPRAQAAPSLPDGRPKMRIIFTTRDPAKVASRPDAVNRYFEVIPMNWSTVLPLYDRENRVCGTLLFEGQQSNDKMAGLFMQMRDLAVSGGRSLSTALVWHRRRTLRGARVLMRWRDRLLATSRRRMFVKYGLPALALIALLAFPFRYRIRGDATLRPVKMHTVAAIIGGRITEINAREGQAVKKDDILCVLESDDLRLQLRQVEQEKERYLTEAQIARQDRNESRMETFRLQARQAEVRIEKLRRDIALSVIRAPFDGILVGPQDLSQRGGHVIRPGETVAEIVDPSSWEVKISVREQDVPVLSAEVERRKATDSAAGVAGELVLTANPNQVYPISLSDPSGFAQRLDTAGGKYNFSTIVPLTSDIANPAGFAADNELKTGYTGRARFSCGRRPLAQILFGDFIRFIKLTFF